MRNFELPGRSEAFGVNGMVATTHPLASIAAINVLREGGNAIDAAVAAAAVLAVVEPSQTGIGGDCFALIKREGKPVVAINGSGAAPSNIDVERLRQDHKAVLPGDSVHAVTVPGALRTWEKLVQDHGSREWAGLLAPAINAAENGYPVTERLARDWSRQTEKLSKLADTAAIFLPHGRAPSAGDVHVQRNLAKTLSEVAASGASAFYEGWIAEDIVASLNALGGSHRLQDLAAFEPRYETPISAAYRGHQLWECPPNGSGVTVLAMATLLDRFDLSALDLQSPERYHILAEIARIAYAERDAFVADPDIAPVPLQHLLSARRADALFPRISNSGRISNLTPIPAPEHKDTVFLTVVDKDRTAVSFINSIFDDFGSGIVSSKSGVLFHNRGCGFVLDEGHPNVLAPGKRPLHTILPAMLTKDGEVELAFGVTGGHFQPIGQIQVLSNILDHGMSVQEAIDAPRIFARGDVLDFEHTVPEAALARLRALGHRPTPAPNPLGTAQAIFIDRKRGLLRGGADPRRDGLALGY
ncbi:gamma-glutamyltransferase [Bosea vaviloviae]|uniref:Glutathione hydrolase proenzyme n=1 Tax=Bosea vaviloviae TaxID=1526658 RepID=A0A1D7UC48_9HYPH|nr:gamma-glutamyltransferase [Bosea vaviloviae]AOO84945.1 gamma-glutamyltransferase [Bosea vaviloviae]